MKFTKLTDNSKVNLAEYIKDYIQKNKSNPIKIYVGTDSHTNYLTTTYVSTVVIHVGNAGCHVLYNREKVKPIYDLWTKLWGEVERSVALTMYLRENGINIHTIDLDLNDKPKYASNKLVNSAIGYVTSMGIKVRIKPDILPAIAAADNLTK